MTFVFSWMELEEHATDNGSSVFNPISNCVNYQYIKNLCCIENKSFGAYTYNINSIQENKNIDSATNWNTLLIKDALHIKLNGLKALKELQLFN